MILAIVCIVYLLFNNYKYKYYFIFKSARSPMNIYRPAAIAAGR